MSLAVPACPHCLTGPEAPLVCDRCGWRWYANPRPAAAVVVERRGESENELSLLLLRRAVDPGRGEWDLPAGYLDPHESFEQAAVRETREESGLTVELVALIGVYHSPPANAVTAVFRGRTDRPDEVRLDFESSEYAWIPRSEVPAWLPRIAFGSMAQAVADWASSRGEVPMRA